MGITPNAIHSGDVVGVMLDLDIGELSFYLNGRCKKVTIIAQ